MVKVYSHSEHEFLKNKKFCIVGYGSQGMAQALNLRDSGVGDITIVLYEGSKSISIAKEDGFAVDTTGSSVKHADVVVMLASDELHKEICEKTLSAHFRPGQVVIFAHGFSVLYGLVELPEFVDVCMVSPKSVGAEVRRRYLARNGVVCFVSVMRDSSGIARMVADSYVSAIAHGNTIIETTFKEEVEANLFSEQVVLCGGLPSFIKCAFETAVESGISPELAYLGCLHEVKLIADLMYRKGLYGMLSNVSRVAGYGASIVGDLLINDEVKHRMRETLDRIQSGEFFNQLAGEMDLGQVTNKHLDKLKDHPIEVVGRRLRDLMQV
ncbi:ketol-acid reductoisomerase [Anaplasma capra]|nr:ketol-acid reductoisomerase [Anaplasma capra]